MPSFVRSVQRVVNPIPVQLQFCRFQQQRIYRASGRSGVFHTSPGVACVGIITQAFRSGPRVTIIRQPVQLLPRSSCPTWNRPFAIKGLCSFATHSVRYRPSGFFVAPSVVPWVCSLGLYHELTEHSFPLHRFSIFVPQLVADSQQVSRRRVNDSGLPVCADLLVVVVLDHRREPMPSNRCTKNPFATCCGLKVDRRRLPRR
jgi:hypothetical protein